ncbi:TPA: triacylglycerol lipase [Staphylococcus pseudintermedius]|nr:triacylglycerol lipase [Staphylococcus pseudintermedius]
MHKINKRNTFALRKRPMGVSSILIASGLLMFAGHDGKAAERSASQDVGVVAKQQELSLYQQKDGDEPTRHDAPTVVNHERETTKKASVDHLHTYTRSSDTTTVSKELDNEKIYGTVPPSPRIPKDQSNEATPVKTEGSHTQLTQKPELDSEFSAIENDNKEAKEQTKHAQRPESDFSVVEQQHKDKYITREVKQAPKVVEASTEDVAPTDADKRNKGVVPDSKINTPSPRLTTHSETQATSAPTITKLDKSAVENKWKHKDPIIFVHGFSGLVGDNAPKGSNYWGGTKYKMIEELRHAGYNVFEASVSAFGSNWARAAELYAYIKGGIVDYGAAHAAKYGHQRYGKTYEGILPNWHSDQKIHLVGHSMGGQTIRLLEQLLRNGDLEEIAYQKENGGTISELFQGNQDNRITSITTIATPHDGTVASDDLGNTEIIKRLLYEYNVFAGRTGQTIDYGLKHWGLEQREGETYAEYAKRASKSPLFTSQDTALYDLTREGAKKLNARTDLNPNIYYKTYTGSATYETIFGTQIAHPYMNIAHVLTGDLIGMTENPAWRENDGLVSVISSQHPEDEAFEFVDFTAPAVKGIWQVTPTLKGWDHTDFTGKDVLDWRRSGAELQNFYHRLVEDLVRKEEV